MRSGSGTGLVTAAVHLVVPLGGHVHQRREPPNEGVAVVPPLRGRGGCEGREARRCRYCPYRVGTWSPPSDAESASVPAAGAHPAPEAVAASAVVGASEAAVRSPGI